MSSERQIYMMTVTFLPTSAVHVTVRGNHQICIPYQRFRFCLTKKYCTDRSYATICQFRAHLRNVDLQIKSVGKHIYNDHLIGKRSLIGQCLSDRLYTTVFFQYEDPPIL